MSHPEPKPASSSSASSSRAKDPKIVAESQSPLGWIGSVFMILAFVVLARGCWSKHNSAKNTEKKQPVTQQYAPRQVPIIKMGKEKTLYTFPASGCVTVHLKGEWNSYPKGGRISFANPVTGAIIMYDEPGKQSTSSLSEADYLICRATPEAWGVEIWQ